MRKTPGWEIQRGEETVRVNKMRNRRSKWGPGKIHWLIYRPQWSAYVKACRTPDDLLLILGGESSWGNVEKDTEITCKSCLKIGWLNG